jgi:Bifunctional DNA primase/polymerase, N-terminal
LYLLNAGGGWRVAFLGSCERRWPPVVDSMFALNCQGQLPMIHELARLYLSRGWAVIPIPAGTKKPIEPGWQKLRLTTDQVDQYFAADNNIGVLLGEPSGWLIDVDLDHPLAVELAAQFLPATAAVFGRGSKRRSH